MPANTEQSWTVWGYRTETGGIWAVARAGLGGLSSLGDRWGTAVARGCLGRARVFENTRVANLQTRTSVVSCRGLLWWTPAVRRRPHTANHLLKSRGISEYDYTARIRATRNARSAK